MTKRINYSETADGTAQDAKDAIDQLETDVSNGDIDGYNVEYRSDVGAVEVVLWRDETVDNLPSAYSDVDSALSNLPISLPAATDAAPAENRP